MASGGTQGPTAPATVIIVNGDPIVGRALELLLKIADYRTKYVAADTLGRIGTLAGVRVLLLGPGWGAESREAVIKAVDGAPGPAEIVILELGEPSDGSPVEPERYVPWPCRTEDLARRINAVLGGEPQADIGV